MDKRFWGILAVIAVIVLGAFWLTSDKKAGAPTGGGQPTQHVEGKNAKKVTLVEYGDYQCPVCGEYYQPVKDAVDKLSDDIQFQFRNLPLTSLHQNAYVAARAAEAAGLQGKYWQMHDMLYESQQSWSSLSDASKTFEGYAKQLGLNVETFKKDYMSERVNDLINADINAFKKTGQEQATPSFFLNGKYVGNSEFVGSNGQPTADKVMQVLKDAIAQQSKDTKSSDKQ